MLVAISFVLITEMINTAIEETIDLITSTDDPRARVAKDMAAGAVLVAAVNALAVAYLIFYDKIAGAPYTVLQRVRNVAHRPDRGGPGHRLRGHHRRQGDRRSRHGPERRSAVRVTPPSPSAAGWR